MEISIYLTSKLLHISRVQACNVLYSQHDSCSWLPAVLQACFFTHQQIYHFLSASHGCFLGCGSLARSSLEELLSEQLYCHGQLLFCNPSVPNILPASLYVSLTWFHASWILGKFIILKRHACRAQKNNCRHSVILQLYLKHCFRHTESWFLSRKTNPRFNMENL